MVQRSIWHLSLPLWDRAQANAGIVEVETALRTADAAEHVAQLRARSVRNRRWKAMDSLSARR
jgi:hypothetical protein